MTGTRQDKEGILSPSGQVSVRQLRSVLALVPRSNKNWPPSMKVKKMEKFENKMGLMGYKCTSLNAPGIKIHLCHPILELGELPFPIIGPLG